jgi:peptide/nickel transport system substrate-binding protein
MGFLNEPYNWDPTYAGAGSSVDYHLVYNTILGWKHGPNVPYAELTLQPELASSWEIPDAETFVFHVRPGVKFASVAPVNGRPLVANDLKFSLEYHSRFGSGFAGLPAGVFAGFFQGLDSVETPDDAAVRVKFKAPFVPFLEYAASPYVPVLAREVYDQDGHFKDRAVGTGPYLVDEPSSQRGTRWVLKRNPTYWDTGKPYIDQINQLVFKDDPSAHAAFQAKQVDLLETGLDLTSVNELTRANPTAFKYETLDVRPFHLYMSVKAGSPLADLRLRQAIALSIDRDEFLKTLFDGRGGWPLAGAFPDTFSQDEIHTLLKHDPAQARQLVQAAGYPNGLDLDFIFPGNFFGQIYITQMQLLQAQLKQVGINLRLASMDYPAYSTLKKQHNFTITDTPKEVSGDIDSYLYNVFYPTSNEDYTEVNDPELNTLLLAQRQETDAGKRREVCRQAVHRINVDQVWALGVYQGLVWNLWNPRLQNYAPHFGLTLTMDNAWLQD